MTLDEDLDAWIEISDFYLVQLIQVELDYFEGKISKIEKNKKQKEISEQLSYSMHINNPFVKNNPRLAEIANRFFQDKDFL